jgi:hypothetical protein
MVQNKTPKNIFVLIIAKISNPFEIFFAKICVTLKIIPTNNNNNSTENVLVEDVIIKNQKVKPALTAIALNLGELVCILNRINESD